MISHKYKCIFIHIPRTGGTSIENVLKDKKNPIASGSTHEKISKYKDTEFFNDYYKFSVVRNPFDRLVSIFMYHSKGGNGSAVDKKRAINMGKDFKTFCKDYLPKSRFRWTQLHYISIDNKVAMDYIIEFENIKAEFKRLSDKLKFTCNLPHTRKTEHKHYSKYYDEETIKIVRKIFADDFRYFNYKFEVI